MATKFSIGVKEKFKEEDLVPFPAWKIMMIPQQKKKS